ncbi:MAG: expansin EXLX1 family cellulose-binding protein [Gallionella sp.]|nr:expansin EXLX1 family cellulose-binding protein [Gallionella sp.]MDD4959612.1 expansin EXLX1 family cellulose-binding protein [Gallionella sp.]
MPLTHQRNSLPQDGKRISRYLICIIFVCCVVCGVVDAAPILHQGLSTYYHANAAASCSMGDSFDYTMTTALGVADYDGSAMCGAYLRVIGPKGEAVVRVVDTCGSCKPGELDLNQEAFEKVADIRRGREPLRWHILSPALNTMVQYHFKAGSNAWWAGVQIRNHRNPVAKLEYLKPDGTWSNIERAKYNYFVQKKPGLGVGPFTFRVTDMFGHSFVDKNIELLAGGTIEGKNQFPFESAPEVPTDVQYAMLAEKHAVPEARQPAPRRIVSVEVRPVYVPKPVPTEEVNSRDSAPTQDQFPDVRNLDQLVNSRTSDNVNAQDDVPDETQDETDVEDPLSDNQNLDQLVNSRTSH